MMKIQLTPFASAELKTKTASEIWIPAFKEQTQT